MDRKNISISREDILRKDDYVRKKMREINSEYKVRDAGLGNNRGKVLGIQKAKNVSGNKVLNIKHGSRQFIKLGERF